MNKLWLTAEVPPGTTILDACIAAVELANKTDVVVWFDFNGVKCLARKGDTPTKIESDWVKQMSSNGEHRIAADREAKPTLGQEIDKFDDEQFKKNGGMPYGTYGGMG